MVGTRSIRRHRAPAAVVMALAMPAICGMLALAIDAGRLYFQRRLMQDAVDAGALAGAQDLIATTSNAPIFQIWGTVFDASGGNGGSIYLRAEQLGPHKPKPTDSDPSGQYGVNGELIGFTMTVDVGNIFGSSAGSPPDCTTGTPNWTGHQGTPGLLVQFNKDFIPTPGVNSYLVK